VPTHCRRTASGIGGEPGEQPLQLAFELPVELEGGRNYLLRLSLIDDGAIQLGGQGILTLSTPNGDQTASVPLEGQKTYVPSGETREYSFTAALDGPAIALSLPYASSLLGEGRSMLSVTSSSGRAICRCLSAGAG
jgi:hypothetical protein